MEICVRSSSTASVLGVVAVDGGKEEYTGKRRRDARLMGTSNMFLCRTVGKLCYLNATMVNLYILYYSRYWTHVQSKIII
jgi:hypothetical protein